MNQAIADALVPFETAAERDSAISLALQAYYTSAQPSRRGWQPST